MPLSDVAKIGAAEIEHRIRHGRAQIRGETGVSLQRVGETGKGSLPDARRPDRQAGLDWKHARRDIGIDGIVGRAVRVEGVACPVIRTSGIVAAGTGMLAIAARLHVPKQCLAQFDRDRLTPSVCEVDQRVNW